MKKGLQGPSREQIDKSSQIDLVLLLARGVKEIHQLYDVAVLQASHYLQLAVFETLVLQDFFNGNHLASLTQLGLVNHSEAAIANHLKRKTKTNVYSSNKPF